MIQNAGMLTLYIVLNIIAVWRTNVWMNRSFRFSQKTKKTVNLITVVVFAALSSMIMIWMPMPVNTFSIEIIRCGNYWLGFLLEYFTVLMLAELIFLLWRRISGRAIGSYSHRVHRRMGAAVLAVSILLTVYGCVNAGKIHINTWDIDINKKAAVKDLKIALAADTHMGYSIGCSQIQDMADKINEIDPDIVILAGDLFDNNFDALEDPEALAAIFRQLQPSYGVYAVFGNHDVCADLVGGFTVGGSRLRDPRMEEFLEEAGIKVMLDDVITFADDSIYLVGRIDEEESGDGKERKSLEELTKGIDYAKPVFVINHEPSALKNYAEHKVDLLFSGHTHAGQTFPLNLAMPLIWDNYYGCSRIGDMYSLVTSGIGVYGPYMRVFTQAEVMEINVHFEGSGQE